uniref:Centrosomal protein of 70 kDa n=1 Tax=Seriola lalandi dorsalis TaxID=1841481 RepID=A0A3B4Y1N5_SERLL
GRWSWRPQEQVEWDDVNKLLRHHGFKPVYFADPVENKNLSGKSSQTMLTDSERRQALIQELIKSNNQLKEEVQEHAGRAARRSRRATELEGLLDTVKTRVQDLEDRYLGKAVQHRSHGQQQQLQREKEESQVCEEALHERAIHLGSLLIQNPWCDLSRNAVRSWSISCRGRGRKRLGFRGNFISPSRKKSVRPSSTTLFICSFQKYRVCCKLRQRKATNSHISGAGTVTVSNFAYHIFAGLIVNGQIGIKKCRRNPDRTDWHCVQELQRGLTELAARLVPGELSDGGHEATEAVKVEDMMLTVDTMLENTSADNKVPRSPTRYTLGSVVSPGVYPRMNEVYARLGEMTNTMKNLRHILDLESFQLTTAIQRSALVFLSIIAKARQHDEFFPPFRALVTDILQILACGVESGIKHGVCDCFPCGYHVFSELI